MKIDISHFCLQPPFVSKDWMKWESRRTPESNLLQRPNPTRFHAGVKGQNVLTKLVKRRFLCWRINVREESHRRTVFSKTYLLVKLMLAEGLRKWMICGYRLKGRAFSPAGSQVDCVTVLLYMLSSYILELLFSNLFLMHMWSTLS